MLPRFSIPTVAAILMFAAMLDTPGSLGAQQNDVVTIGAGEFSRGLHSLELDSILELCRGTGSGIGDTGCRPELYELEMPRRRIRLSAFGIDRHEVTRARYMACVDAGVCLPTRTRASDERVAGDSLPVTGVTWNDAKRFCRWTGGRLPTESEWERAARGVAGRRFPWGRIYNDRLSNHGHRGQADPIDGFRHLAPVGSFPLGASADGLLDMAGNVWEWTHDAFDGNETWESELPFDPQGAPSGGEHLVRGGSWRSSPVELRTTVRIPVPADTTAPDLGFRCAYDVR